MNRFFIRLLLIRMNLILSLTIYHNVMKSLFVIRFLVFFLLINSTGFSGYTQSWQLVWSDEFNEDVLNTGNWNFEQGTIAEHVHYYTNRIENCQLSEGNLLIIARRESYMGQEYTSSKINTINKVEWKYGKIEARMKIPNTPGLVSAFWMMPINGIYGFWPNSGEIDIMEHPTHEPQNIYGTIHTGAYNLFGGSGGPPRGGIVSVPDLEYNYHTYSIEWTPDSIHHLIDGQRYCSFNNDYDSTDTWPFDQPFYIILNLSVGGYWAGNPDPGDPYPDTLKVDYVRLYQNIENLHISGSDFPEYNAQNKVYRVPIPAEATSLWSVPAGATITSGQNTNEITVDWGDTEGVVSVEIVDGSDSYSADYPVVLSYNKIKNGGFERGIKYWSSGVASSTDALITLEYDTGTENKFIKTDVNAPGVVPWDIQISQKELELENGFQYEGSFKAKSIHNGSSIDMAIINSQNYQLYYNHSYTLSEEWNIYSFEFAMTEDASGAFNFDLAGDTGIFYIDDVSLVEIVDIQSDESVKTSSEDPTELVYPNPSNGHFTLQLLGLKEQYLIEIFDSLGQLVYSEEKSGSIHKFDLRERERGVYFIRISSNTEQIIQKIIIQ